MNNAVLSCRICEETHPLAPVSHCAACSGPLDVRYISNGNGSLLADPQELSSDRALLPHRETAIPNRTPLVPAPRVSAALGIDVHLKLETANPTSSFKDRMAASAVKAAQEFGFGTVLCASTGNLGAAVAAHCAGCRPRRSHPHARRRGATRTPAGHRGHERLPSARDARGLPPAGARPRDALPVGVPGREPATVRGRGDQDDRLRDRRAARLGAAGRDRQPRRLGRSLRKAGPGIRRARRAGARRRPAAADVRRAARWLPARRRRLGRRASAVARDAEHGCPLARGR